MKITAKTHKEKVGWSIEIPDLDAWTQGDTEQEALEMAAAVVDDLAGYSLGTSAVWVGRKIEITCTDTAGLVALILRQRRESSGLTLKDIAAKLGFKSVNAYARYEQGVSVPTVEKLDRLLEAVGAGGLRLGV